MNILRPSNFDMLLPPPPQIPPFAATMAESRFGMLTHERPGFVIMPPEMPAYHPQPAPEMEAIRAKFLYWGGITQRLHRDEYLDRLLFETYEYGLKAYHGATGEERRYVRWRLAFRESMRLMDVMGIE